MTTVAPRALALALLAAAPATLVAQNPRAPKTPSAAVQEFMRALADSNLTRMAELWGTAKGPVSKTRPKDYEKRIMIMQMFLHGVEAQTLGDVPSDKSGVRSVTTRLAHRGCKVTLPIDVVKTKEGWLVTNFDLAEAGHVNQPCDTGKPGNPPV
ncbi:MAG: hypothetical protein ACRELE_02630 [Gemmatimonadales bacterium]